MPYTINRYDGQQLVQVQDATIDESTCDLKLVGRNYAGYGEAQNENFVFLLENFARGTQPDNPLTGQIWYDSSTNKLKFYDGDSFRSTARIEVGTTAPTSKITGDFWFNTSNNQLSAWNGSSYTLIGPEGGSPSGTTKIVSATVKDTSNIDHNILKGIVNDVVIFIVSSDASFTLNNEVNPISNFDVIHEGITLIHTINATNGVTSSIHRFWGTATNAEKLNGQTANQFHPAGGLSNLALAASTLTASSVVSSGLTLSGLSSSTSGDALVVDGSGNVSKRTWPSSGGGTAPPSGTGIARVTQGAWDTTLSFGSSTQYLSGTGSWANIGDWQTIDINTKNLRVDGNVVPINSAPIPVLNNAASATTTDFSASVAGQGVGISVQNLANSQSNSQYKGYLYASETQAGVFTTALVSDAEIVHVATLHRWRVHTYNSESTTDMLVLGNTNFQPVVGTTVALGNSNAPWSVVYSSTATIQPSDIRKKTDVLDSDLGLEFILQLRPVSYKLIEGETKQVYNPETDTSETVVIRPGIRPHYGLIAQEVKTVLGDKDFAGYIHDEQFDSYGLRYGEFISPMIKAIQEMKTEYDSIITELRQEIAALKA